MNAEPFALPRRAARRLHLAGLIRKEFLQIRRDPSSIGIAFLLPIVLLIIFGYGVSLDAKHVRIGLVAENPGPETADFFAGLQRSEYFQPAYFPDLSKAQEALDRREVSAIAHLRGDFARQALNKQTAPIQVLLDGVDANTARLVSGYLQGAWTQWLNRQADQRAQASMQAVQMQQRIWFNPAVRSRDYLVPGLIAVIMTLIGALLTAMVVAREWDRGTLEALMATPVSVGEVLVGKLAPYYLLGMGGMILSIGMALYLFDVPLRGSLWVLLATGTLFLLAALGMGLFISIVAQNQFVAGQVAIIATFLPAFILSGFIFDIGSMPAAVQAFTYLIAARYFVAILQTVFLAGDVWEVIVPNALALAAMAAVFLTLAARRMPRRLG
ncbi:ABC transporter permease [Methylococcus geothermalis]|uniref:ABC transporter permease subunit n=1 Tax=Methylococcus geothermalis TaxID=2681310 RepID=A0A858Q9L2_9GAMM|nr:ABC transporter permease [Methylococcus geothermalis]QJD30414.1 ABC transporter permease subunit [Methylococcus geothermalis]